MPSFLLRGGWLTTKEVAELLRVHPKHVYRLLKRGLPAQQVGGHWRFSPAEVQGWMARGRPLDVGTTGIQEKQSATRSAGAGLLATNGDLAVEALVGQVNAERPALGLVVADTVPALDWLLADEVLAIGVLGECSAAVPGGALARLQLGHEQLGLAAAPGRLPPALAGLDTRRQRLASFREGSDVRSQLDGVLRREGHDPGRSHRRALLVSSYAEVVSALLTGRATVGVTTAAWARRFALPFVPLASRPLGLVTRAENLGHPALVRCWHAVQSVGFADAAAALGGLDLSEAGQISYLTTELESPLPGGLARGSSAVARGGGAQRETSGSARSRWVLLLRPRGGTARSTLRELTTRLRARGVGVGGFVQVPVQRRGERIAYELRRLTSAERVVVARRARARARGPAAARSFQFVPEAFAPARGWLEQDAATAAVLVIDGVGTLEARGGGHREALVWASRQRAAKVVVVAVRRDQAAGLAQRLGLGRRQLAVLDEDAAREQLGQLVEAIAAQIDD